MSGPGWLAQEHTAAQQAWVPLAGPSLRTDRLGDDLLVVACRARPVLRLEELHELLLVLLGTGEGRRRRSSVAVTPGWRSAIIINPNRQLPCSLLCVCTTHPVERPHVHPHAAQVVAAFMLHCLHLCCCCRCCCWLLLVAAAKEGAALTLTRSHSTRTNTHRLTRNDNGRSDQRTRPVQGGGGR